MVSLVCSLDNVILYIADIAGRKDCIKKLVEKILSSVEESTDVGILDHVESVLTKASKLKSPKSKNAYKVITAYVSYLQLCT